MDKDDGRTSLVGRISNYLRLGTGGALLGLTISGLACSAPKPEPRISWAVERSWGHELELIPSDYVKQTIVLQEWPRYVGTLPEGEVVATVIPDLNGDRQDDMVVDFPDGHRELLYASIRDPDTHGFVSRNSLYAPKMTSCDKMIDYDAIERAFKERER